ncbi:60S acidic ribosomal protein P2 [Mycoblastus sanguinarius]|nr:60S acidic ribosomal protein P2 [Mycoblastus sanguinarius]
MKHLAAYLLLGLGGNTSPSAADVKGVLESVGIDADEERLDKLIAELKGKDLQELIAEGSTKLASVPSGGGGGGGPTTTAPGPGGPAEPEPEDKPVEEEKEESDEDMGFGLFD